MPLAFYISHPQVVIDPGRPVPKWHLTDEGRARVDGVLGEPWIGRLARLASSTETKAVETAERIAGSTGIPMTTDAAFDEIDRSGTGYVPHAEHEAIADAFFANPHRSVRGWERAADAQRRIVGAVDTALREAPPGDIAFIGHGGVGTLLLCSLKGVAIDRRYDQPGSGCVYAFRPETRSVLFDWHPIEQVSALLTDL